jgi:hypothetical protein
MGKTFSTGLLTNGIWQDSSNNIGIGAAANASYKLQVTGTTNLTGALTGTSAEFSGNNHSLASNNTLRFTDTDTATEANQQIGKIEFYSSDTSTPGAGVKAYIGAFAQDTTPDAYLSFATQDGSATPNPVERLRISSEGLATFSSSVTATDQIKVSGSGAYLSIYDTQASSKNWAIRAGHDAVGDLAIRQSNSTGGDPVSAGTNRLYFSSTGAATFSSSVTADGQLKTTATGQSISINAAGTGSVRMQLQNTSGNAGVTVESSTGGDQFSGTSAYSMAIGTYTARDLFFGTNSVARMTITSGGNVGIGTSSPSSFGNYTNVTIKGGSSGANLDLFDGGGTRRASFVLNGSTQSYIGTTTNIPFDITQNDGTVIRCTATTQNVLIGTTTDSAGVRLKVAGGIIGCLDVYNNTTGVGANVNIDANGFFARSTSSLKYKKNINNLTKGLNEVLQLRPVTYNSINETETQTYAGLIAEEVHELGLTEFVQYAEDGTPDALSYGNMVSLLVKAIQELEARIKQLENK